MHDESLPGRSKVYPGKRRLTDALAFPADHPASKPPAASGTRPPPARSVPATIQMLFGGHLAQNGEHRSRTIEAAAARGVDAPTSALPHRDRIAASFGRHAVDGIQAHTGPAAAAAARDMGALAFATGDHVVLGDTSLRTVAHEAAHVIQQRAGIHPRTGDDNRGDRWECHADAVADLVVRGDSAAALLDEVAPPDAIAAAPAPAAAVQRMVIEGHDTANGEDFSSWIGDLRGKGEVELLRHVLGKLQNSKLPHEAKARSLVQRALDQLAKPAPQRGEHEPPRLDHLPRDQWWKLFIDGDQHTGDHENNAMTFDNEKSPGYYGTMSKAFEGFVSGSSGQQIDFEEYDRMHEGVTHGTMRWTEVGDHGGFLPVPDTLSGPNGSFPMTLGEYPNPDALRELFEEHTLRLDDGQRSKLAEGEHEENHGELEEGLVKLNRHEAMGEGGHDRMSTVLGRIYQDQVPEDTTFPAFMSLNTHDNRSQLKVTTDMPTKNVPDQVNLLFAGYYQQIAQLGELEPQEKRFQQLKAIAKLVRALHVGHYYEDANGRLNTMLLLDRLLVDLGLHPIILPRTDIFGGAYTTEELANAMEDGLNAFERELPGYVPKQVTQVKDISKGVPKVVSFEDFFNDDI